ncbi:MAG: sigma-70 family RNA polymerase sigma factor [Clostridia bacterium]|nr:sigma-70 family RNA polymerase sigma factor [Clostridia bacterium]
MDVNERNKFIEGHFGLVHSCCRRFTGKGIEYDDLFQAGSIGLIKAADGFDESRNVCFSTYAVPVILGEIKRLFRDGGSVKVSRGLKELSLKTTAVREKLQKTLSREPTIQEIAEVLSVSEEEIAQALDAARPTISLSEKGDDGEENGVADIPVDYNDEIINKLTVGEIRRMLGDNDWRIIGLRFFKGSTQQETANALGMTQVQVSRRERAILKELKDKFA